MNTLKASLTVLKDITVNKLSFHESLKKTFLDEKNFNGIQPTDVSAFVGCELRHYIVFKSLVEEKFKIDNENVQLAIGLALANGLFLKRLDNETCYQFVLDTLQNEKIELNNDELKAFLQAKYDGEPLIDPQLNKISFSFISKRYNVMEWMAKMWAHSFNKNTAYKIARANTKNPTQFLRVNTLLTDKEKLLKEYKEELLPCELNDEMVMYNGKQAVRKKKFILQNRCFQENLALKELLDKLPIDLFKPIVIFSGSYNIVPLELGVKYKNQLKIDNLTTPNKDVYLFKNNLNRYQIKNVSNIECDIGYMMTAISNKVPLFILLPENSNFDRLRIDPDYFLHFDKNTLDTLINKQKAAIEEASSFVEDDGLLVYSVSTIDKKESSNIVSSFLKDHPDFTLIEEKQHFPYDTCNASMYYAILKKVGEHID